jgi:hypothetical protein
MNLQERFDRVCERGVEHRSDCLRIQTVALETGIVIDICDAEKLWHWYSRRRSAGWLNLGTDDEIRNALTLYIDEHQPEKYL